ncbi:MAG: exodeoxyribonuclease VII small subunit [Acidimicrobiia bacterium]|nr:exodeoxyribonuclease VII small subunit [Acidimicrobiia bacterium]
MTDEMSYRDALDELESILVAIEEEQVDVDDLAVKVRRSAELIRLCRERIEAATVAVEAIVEEMDSEEGTDG